jgi:hypothetical protein
MRLGCPDVDSFSIHLSLSLVFTTLLFITALRARITVKSEE